MWHPFRSAAATRLRLLETEERLRTLDREERREERELFRASIAAMTAMCQTAFRAQEAQQMAFTRFLSAFDTPDAPKLREWDEAEADARFLDKRGKAVPAELAGLDKIDQFKMLIDKMNGFAS